MKNIIKIFKSDMKGLFKNFLALVVAGGLCLLPALYAWFNIYANWDPYANTGNIDIIVVNLDKGIEQDGVTKNMGDSLVESLKEKDSIHWVFLDTEKEAVDQIKSGDCYAALVIDKDFSYGMYNGVKGEVESPKITYYVNGKKNAVATKITDSAVSSVQSSLDKTYVQVLAEQIFVETNIAVEDVEADEIINQVTLKLEGVSESLGTCQEKIDGFIEANRNIENVVTGAGTALSVAQGKLEDCRSALVVVKDKVKDMPDAYEGIGLTVDSLDKMIQNLSSATGSASDMFLATEGNAENLNASLLEVKSVLGASKERIDEALERIQSAGTAEKLETILKLLSGDPERLGEFFAEPVHVEDHYIYEIKNYGSSVAPFYTTLALWVGMTILVSLIKVHAKPDGISNVKKYQLYLGRYLTFFVMSQIQTLIIVLGNLFVLRIQCVHPFLFWVASAMTSLTFSLLVYSLTIAFGDIGKAFAVVIMVIQIAGSGGTYPIEALPGFFQAVYIFFPFPYAINAMRECIGGMYQVNFEVCMIQLGGFCLAALVIGLVIRIPFIGINHYIEERMEETEMM